MACGGGDGARLDGDALEALSAARLPRPFAARLSIPVEYRPCAAAPSAAGSTVAAEACGPAPTPSAEVLAAAERASAGASGGVDPRALHAAGLMDLLWGGEGGISLDRGLHLLETAARLSDRPAPVLADLAAARLVRAERTGSIRDLLRAYEAAAEALEREPGLPAACFDRALALDRLGLGDEAARAWAGCAGAEAGSPWAAEAREPGGRGLGAPVSRPRPRGACRGGGVRAG